METERLSKPGESVSPPFVRARKQQRLVEHFWLCDDCATQWTLVYDQNRGIALAPVAQEKQAAAVVRSARSGAA